METKSLRLLVVDDHPAFRFGLVGMLEGLPDMAVVAEATDGVEAVEIFRRVLPDIVLMDLRLPRLSGVEAIQQIRREFPDAQIIVITTFDADEDIYRAIMAGAMSYLLKDSSREEIVEKVRAVAEGKNILPPAVAKSLFERMSREGLTPRELKVLELLVKGRSNKEIADELKVAEVTVKFHLKSLFAKLDVQDRTQAAVEAIRHGIVHLEQGS
jgi:two-component system NarL family response regulator